MTASPGAAFFELWQKRSESSEIIYKGGTNANLVAMSYGDCCALSSVPLRDTFLLAAAGLLKATAPRRPQPRKNFSAVTRRSRGSSFFDRRREPLITRNFNRLLGRRRRLVASWLVSPGARNERGPASGRTLQRTRGDTSGRQGEAAAGRESPGRGTRQHKNAAAEDHSPEERSLDPDGVGQLRSHSLN